MHKLIIKYFPAVYEIVIPKASRNVNVTVRRYQLCACVSVKPTCVYAPNR